MNSASVDVHEARFQPSRPLSNIHVEGSAPFSTELDPFSLENLRQSLELQEGTEPTEAVARAEKLASAADSIMRELHDKIMQRVGISTDIESFINAALKDDKDELKKRGFNTDYATVDHILAAMINGRPPIEIETVGPYAAAHETEAGKLEIKMESLPPDEVAGIYLSVALRQFAEASSDTVRIVSLVDELNNYTSGRNFTPEEQAEYVRAITDFYTQAGLIREGDELGKDVVLLRESSQIERVPEMITRLRASIVSKGIGSLEEKEDGSVTFRPTKEFIDQLGIKSKNRLKEFEKRGIALIDKGRPLCQTLDAASFLKEENRYLMHVVMLDKTMEAQQDKVYALLTAIDIISSPEQYHNIFADMNSESALPPELVTFATIAHFRNRLHYLLSSSSKNSQHSVQDSRQAA